MIKNPLKYDPTRTVTLRRAFSTQMSKRFNALKQRLKQLVVVENPFGLTTNAVWPFMTAERKLEEFKKWLMQQIGETIFQTDRYNPFSWLETYISQGYKKGLERAWTDTWKRPTGIVRLSPEAGAAYQAGGKAEFLRKSFGGQVSTERVKILASRAYTDLQSVTDQMSGAIARTLVDGMIAGNSPREVGQELDKIVDGYKNRGTAIARTETIRAHAEGSLNGLEELGVEKIAVMVEWSTAEDEKVCHKCKDLQGIVLNPSEAHGLIPRHPNCVTGDSVINAPGLVAVMSGKYTGVIHKLTTANNRHLSTTSHHVMLTQRGWVFAKDVTDSDYLLYCPLADLGVMAPNEYLSKATISDIYHAFVEVGDKSLISKSLSMAHDLHGDGQFIDSEIDIVGTDSILRSDWQSSNYAQLIKGLLKFGNIGMEQSSLLNSGRALHSFLQRAGSAADSLVSSLCITEILLARSLPHHQSIGSSNVPGIEASLDESLVDRVSGASKPSSKGIGTLTILEEADHKVIRQFDAFRPGISKRIQILSSPKINSGSFKTLGNTVSADPKLLTEFRNGLPTGVQFDKVLSVDLVHVQSSAVYDVSTASTLYTVGGFLTSNCRCSFVPANVGEKTDAQKRSQASIYAAITASLQRDKPKRKTTTRKSSWAGANTSISKVRPATFKV